MGTCPGLRDLLLHFDFPIHAIAVATNFKFGAQIDNKKYSATSVKLL